MDWCRGHALDVTGSEDGGVSVSGDRPPVADATGQDNRRWCALLHRRLPG